MLAQLGGQSFESSSPTLTQSAVTAAKPIFATEAEQRVAQVTYQVIQQQYEYLASSNLLLKEDVQKKIVATVEAALAPTQQEFEGVEDVGLIVGNNDASCHRVRAVPEMGFMRSFCPVSGIRT